MKHLKQVTKRLPKRADVWQDVLCTLATAMVSLLSTKGGSVPMLTWLNDKCQPSTLLES